MAIVEPIPDEAAAIADLGTERALVVADYHAGIEAALRVDCGIELRSGARERRDLVHGLLDRTAADRLVFLGDLMHSIGEATGAERGELEVLLEGLSLPVTVVKGNHDGAIERLLDAKPKTFDGVTVTPSRGVRLGDIGFVHGHTWPTEDVLAAKVVCMGHEHPRVRLVDDVGGSRLERAWLRGRLTPEPFEERLGGIEWNDPTLVVLPAFNELVSGTWVNVDGREFLSPFLPAGLRTGELYLLDGTRLGEYRKG